MGYKKLCLDRYLCPNHLANSLQFSAYNLIESALTERSDALEVHWVSFANQHHRTAHQLWWPLHSASSKKPQEPAGRLKVIDLVWSALFGKEQVLWCWRGAWAMFLGNGSRPKGMDMGQVQAHIFSGSLPIGRSNIFEILFNWAGSWSFFNHQFHWLNENTKIR